MWFRESKLLDKKVQKVEVILFAKQLIWLLYDCGQYEGRRL